MNQTITRIIVAALAVTFTALDASAETAIKRIYIIHFSHTDVGFTDMPGVCREMQCRYLDIAIDGVLASMSKPEDQRMHWTCESLITVDDWWRAASPDRREDFLKALRSGQLDVAALPCNQAPFLNAAQWQTMLHWIPEELWQQCQPTVALQNDVNGFPRAGAMALARSRRSASVHRHQRRQRRAAQVSSLRILVEDAGWPAAVRLAEPELSRRL